MFALSQFPSSGPPSGYTSEVESFGSLSLSSFGPSHNDRLGLPRDILQEILLLTIFLEGSMRQYSPLCLVCREWDCLLNEPYSWAALARRFVPAFPLIHTARFVPIVIPKALSSTLEDTSTASLFPSSRSVLGSSASNSNTAGHRSRSMSTLRGGGGGGAVARVLSSQPTRVRRERIARRRMLGQEEGGEGLVTAQHLRTLSSNSNTSCHSDGVANASVASTPPPLLTPTSVGASSSTLFADASAHLPRPSSTTSAAKAPAGGFAPSAIKKQIMQQWVRRRRQALRTMREAINHSDDEQRRQGAIPQRETVKAAVEGLKEYQQWLLMNQLVAQRRRFVLQAWMSGGLFFATCAVGADVCAAEGWHPASFCSFDVGFSFFYLAHVCVFGVVISNVFMATHYEPIALIPRVSRNTSLIAVSTLFLVAWICGVIVPTYLVQLKVGGMVRQWEWEAVAMGAAEEEAAASGLPLAPTGNSITWTHTVSSLAGAMLMWQLGVVITLWKDVAGWCRRPHFLSWSDVTYLVPHLTPLLLALSALAFAAYLDTGAFWLLAVTCLPYMAIFGILTGIFSLDAYHHGRESDMVVAIALGNLVISFLLLLTAEKPRGLHCVPVFVCCFTMFVGQMRSMLRLLDSVRWDED